jgi:copper homeostasis protein
VLTSGGERDVVAGSVRIARLVGRAAGRIEITVGGGLRLENAPSVAHATKAASFHGSLRRRVTVDGVFGQEDVFGEGAGVRHVVRAEDIREIVGALHHA